MASAGAAVVYSFPSIIVPKNLAPAYPIYPTQYALRMRGLPYIINNMGDYFGLSRATWRAEGNILVPAPPTESEIMEFPTGWQSLIPEDYQRAKAV